MVTVRFQGEDAWDAVINDNSLNIEEEQAFEEYLEQIYDEPKKLPLEQLEMLFKEWIQELG